MRITDPAERWKYLDNPTPSNSNPPPVFWNTGKDSGAGCEYGRIIHSEVIEQNDWIGANVFVLTPNGVRFYSTSHAFSFIISGDEEFPKAWKQWRKALNVLRNDEVCPYP